MKYTHQIRRLLALTSAVAILVGTARADVVETSNGSIINGKIIASEGGVIKIETEFAGVIEIKKDQVKSLVTDAPVNVALLDGTTAMGTITTEGSALSLATTTGTLTTRTADISAVWLDGDKSPLEKALEAAKRKWSYQVGFDLNGKKGNTDRIFLGTDFMAVLQSPDDRLAFYGRYARGEEEGNVTQDEAKGGVDYSNFFTERMSWYVRTELGFDRTKDLDLRSQTAAGLGYHFIKQEKWKLEGRFGLNYRFEDYGATEDFDSAGIDLGLLHSYEFTWGKMLNIVTMTPSFDDFSNYVLLHESVIEMPIATGEFWKLRFGIRNDFTSKPSNPALEKHDWSYFSQLVLSWK